MFARLTALVGSGSALPFELGDPQPAAWGQWDHFKGTWKADNTPVSVFRISAMNKSDAKLNAARNSAKRLRMLRHPNILSFKDTIEVEEGNETRIYLVTEAITPLASVLKSIDLSGNDKDLYMAMGLQQVVSAVSFVNNDCKLIHGNICMGAIAVTNSLDWKLHAFDIATEHNWNEAMTREMPIVYATWMVGAQYKPGEVAKNEWEVVRESPPYSVDSWGLGCLMQEIYSGSMLSRTEDLRNTDCIPESVLPYYQKLLASQPSRRLDPGKFAESGVLKNKMVELVAFLENLALKDAAEKDMFFKRLPSMLPKVPTPVAQRKLLPMLASALEFGGAPPVALTTLLQIGNTLPEATQEEQVVPILTKLFASTDRGIRRGLLENIQSFGASLPTSLVEDQIFKHVESGFNDANPYLRELTLKSMVVLGPKLSQKTLNQSVLKYLAKLQVDEEPSIRANTTVLLGNLAPYLGDASCKKVLLNAFTRAMKDPFPPARAAGLRAIIGTAKYHGAEAAATRVLPMVGPLCIDPVQEVRTSAIQCVDHFVGVLQTHHKEMCEKEKAAAAAAAAASGNHGPGSTGQAPSGSAAASGGLLTSFGWAVSSLGLSRGAAADTPASHIGNLPSQPHPALSNGGAGVNNMSNNSSMSRPMSATTAPSAAPAPPTTTTSNNGWDNDDDQDNGWDNDDDDPFEDMMASAEQEKKEKEARERLQRLNTKPASSAAAARPRPASANRPTSTAGAVKPAAATKPKSMKLGAAKLTLPDDSEFNDW